LIVEFAIQRHAAGKSVLEAAMEGAKARFRPILMTSFAFIAGLLPLVFATGPGKIGNRTIGTAAAGGCLYHLWCLLFLIVLHLWSNSRENKLVKVKKKIH
jgi:HAE1 family hydrophobic/amphiphilic exporter-1